MGFLKPGDRAEGVVVHHHPDHPQPFLARRRQHRRIPAEATIADHGDDHLVRAGAFDAQRRRGAEAHGGVTARHRADLNAPHAMGLQAVNEMQLFLNGKGPLLVLQAVAKGLILDEDFGWKPQHLVRLVPQHFGKAC